MERQKRWQLYIIVAVLLITLYNILPTIFFYSKPLKEPIGADRAHQVAEQIVTRVDGMEEQSVAWLQSFASLLHVQPTKIEVRQDDPHLINVVFSTRAEAQRFKTFLPQAGAMIPFVPAQLQLGSEVADDQNVTLVVERRIGTRFDSNDINQLFQFSDRFDAQGQPSPMYRTLVFDRVANLGAVVAGPSFKGQEIIAAISGDKATQQEVLLTLAQDIVNTKKALTGGNEAIFKRIAASYSQVAGLPQGGVSKTLINLMKDAVAKTNAQKQALAGKGGEAAANLEPEARERLTVLNQQLTALNQAVAILQQYQADIDTANKPLTFGQLHHQLEQEANSGKSRQTLDLAGYNPFIKGLTIDWIGGAVRADLYPDVAAIVSNPATSEEGAFIKEKVNQLLIGEVAYISQHADENLIPQNEAYGFALSNLNDSHSFLAFDLGSLAKREVVQVEELLNQSWNPKHGDLVRNAYPVRSFDDYLKQSAQDQRLGLVVYAPAMYHELPPEGFDTDGIYVIARGLQDIIQKYRDVPSSESNQVFGTDFNALVSLLEQRGFMHYPGNSWGVSPLFSKDYIFHLPNYYDNLLKATREDFTVKGRKQYAVLDFTDVEQRILTLNRIEDKEHEDLLKWRDEYHAAQVDLNPINRYYVPAPTSNVYWDNLKLSTRKYFRGDDSKVLKWGLDLSGGKTVRIGLTDQNGQPVTKPDDLNQAVNELYVRINKMGVAERSIRLEGSNIILDFPGSQGLSATELVKASTMTFHIINEKFGPAPRGRASSDNTDLLTASDHFLQDVWNEAVVTNRKDIDSVNAIAWRHLGGDDAVGQMFPRSESAKLLWDNGLRLGNPKDKAISGTFNDAISSVAIYRGDDFSDWQGRTHPLVIVFHNYALEGASLTNVQVGYDPSEGNFLSFEVKGSYEGNRIGNPRDDFYAWTSRFSKEQIEGTLNEKYSGGEGWRMAVVLNDRIISSPTLQAALRDRARITGRFSQRDVQQLAADLKAGSLSFTPRILAEQNISPDLGLEERSKGITASIIAICAVVVAMVTYYRFAGVVASVAVLLNLFIMWGVLQNIGAALTLSGIAGLVLTIGMAVDANVLVFERFREEFKQSGRLASAIQAGYRKAFSAIIDSNLTTLLAALILTQFDSGPVKGFATIIMIGIVSSMFTALFMTRYFFAGWVQNPNHRELKMRHWIGNTNFDFLGYGKKALMVAALLAVGSALLLSSQWSTILGMDFTGGYALTLEVQEKPGVSSYRLAVKEALERHGILSKDVQVKQLSRPTQLKIQLGMGVEESGRPFYKLPEELPEGKYDYAYQRNPRIDWVVKALSEADLQVRKGDLEQLDSQWTVMSGQFSDAMRNNALEALALALIAILIYITFRFEFKYAIAAVIGLAFDVIVSLGVLALFHLMGFGVQLDLEIVGAVMMIIGYALNDTIIVFDRIREDIRVLRKMEFRDMVNHALNVTLSRTLMTSGTTLLVLLCLVLFGGSALFGFSLAMAVGVIIGTLSSLFVCSPIMLFFHEREVRRHEAEAKLKKA